MDLNRIESVTILKDASAKAIYGSKAANGVIVIETTKVKPGELRINYTGTVNVEAPDLSSYNLTNAREKLDLENQLGAYAPTSNVPYYGLAKDSLYFANYNGVQRGVNTDWLAQPLRNGIGYKHSLDMQVGTDALLAGLTLFTGNTQGAMKGSERGTYGGAFTLVNRYKKLLFRNILEYSVTNATNSPYGDFSQYVALNPYWTPTNPDGSLKQFLGLGPVYTQQVYNPLYDAAYVSNTNKYSTLTNNTNLEYTFNPMFKLVGRFSFTNGTNGSDVFYSSKHSKFLNYTADNFYTKGSYDKTVGTSSAYSSDLYLNYNKTFGRNMIFVNAGASIHEDNSTNYLFSAVGFPNDRMNDIMFANQYAPNGKPSGSSSLNREIGLLATGNYSYADRYFADFSIRRNASSQFGSNNRWGNFWSAGAGWNIHKEAFFHQLSGVITQLKLRGSMGYTGSQNFNSYQGMLLYNYYTNASYQGMLGTYLKGLANNNLQWQQRYDANVGVDMTIMNRVSIRFDRYRSTTNNLLTDITVPPSLGFSSYKENLGQLLNTGYEFKVSYRCLVNTANRSSLNVYVSGASNTNTIQKISNSLQTLNATQDKLSATSNKPLVMFKEGQSLDAIWAVRSLGIDPSNGKEIFIKADGSLTNTWDVNDKVVVGNSQPKLFGVFGANYEYKGFTLGVACRYTTGSQMYNQTLVDRVENASLNYNVDKRAYYDSWKKPGDIALYRNIGIYPTATYATSRFVQDLNEWDISSVNIGYDFYKFQWLKKVNVQRLRVMFNMNDLAQFSSIQIERGTSYPFAHVYSMSVFANF
jgi:TonB-linked SusC/RagA family outer membrane protein